jgi:putative holliday junction resolvase
MPKVPVNIPGKVLAIDYGSVRIGIALSDDTQTIAFGREAVKTDAKSVDTIKKIALDENVSVIVLGYPLNLKGEKTPQTREVEIFEQKLKAAFGNSGITNINFVRFDERFTSKMASDSMIESGMKKKKRQDKSNIDIISAAILLQGYLDSLSREGGKP